MIFAKLDLSRFFIFRKIASGNKHCLAFKCLPLLCLLLSSVTHADRPKVGLVLGGGGAAGVAHVGVLKVLEQQNIPIDYVAGTSMGAIIAGLYASGMTADELEGAVHSLDWLALFDDKPSRQDLGFHQKRLNSGFFNSGKLGVKNGEISVPSGLVNGQKLLFELRRLFRPVSYINDFDDLEIPFRAVATDIETGQQVVLKQGNIAQAIRASMSIPGLFSPVRIEDQLLVDGFVANNVPVEVVRDMGADILIVVNIPSYLEKKSDLNSALDISLQAMQLMMLKSSAPQLKTLGSNDILIEPGVRDISSLSFDRVKETIPLGVQAAKDNLPALQRLAKSLESYSNVKTVQALQSKLGGPELLTARINTIKLNNESILEDEILLGRLGIKVGQRLDSQKLQKGLDAIYGLGHFDLVDYSLAPDSQGGADLTINAYKSTIGDSYFNFGASLADNLDGDTSYQFGIKHTRSDMNNKGAEWSNSLVMGDSIRAESQFYQPIPSQNAFLDATASYQEQDIFVFDGEQRVSEVRGKQAGVSVDVGKEFGTWGEARLGVYYANVELNEKTGTIANAINIDEATLKSAGLRAQFSVDTTDNDLLPSTGTRFDATYTHGSEFLGGDQEFDQLALTASKSWNFDKNRFIVSGELGTSFDDDVVSTEKFSLGGLGRLSGLANDQLSGNHLVLGSAVYMRELSKIPVFDGALYAGVSVEVGNVWQDKDEIESSDLLTTAGVFLGAETPLGLAVFGAAKTERFDIQPYFYLGQGF